MPVQTFLFANNLQTTVQIAMTVTPLFFRARSLPGKWEPAVITDALLLVIAGLLAGALNAVAGGGTDRFPERIKRAGSDIAIDDT